MPPSVNIKYRYQSAKEPDIDTDCNRVAIMFFKYFWCVRRFRDLKIYNHL